MDKISVITVCLNNAETISDTIESVIEQDCLDIEYIIIDGVSRDGTLDIINRYREHITTVISEADKGIYDAMNKGISLATGDVTGFLNADDIYVDKKVIKKVHRTFLEDDIDACYGDLVYVSNESTDKIVRYWKSKPYTKGLCLNGWMPAHPTFFVRTDILKGVGGFNIDYKLQSDFDLCLRLFEIEKIQTRYIHEILVKMRTGGVSNNSLTNIVKGNMEAYRSCKYHFPDTSPLFIPKKIFSRVGQYFKKPGLS